MLCLLFSVGNRRFCIAAENVLRVLNKVGIEPIAEAPHFVEGIIQFQNQWLPVLDLCELATGESCRNNMSTRMIITEYDSPNREAAKIALIAESVDDTIEIDPEKFQSASLTLKSHQFFGEILHDGSDIIQLLKPEHLLSAEALEIIAPALAEKIE